MLEPEYLDATPSSAIYQLRDLGKVLKSSVPQFPHLRNEHISNHKDMKINLLFTKFLEYYSIQGEVYVSVY